MKGVFEGNNLVLFTGWISCLANLAGKFYGGFIGLAAGIADEDFGGILHSSRGDRFRDD